MTAGALTLALALAVPAGAGAAPLPWTDAGALLAGAWHRLLSLWGENGLGMDPNGRPVPPQAVWGENGLGIDPDGRPAPPPVAAGIPGQV